MNISATTTLRNKLGLLMIGSAMTLTPCAAQNVIRNNTNPVSDVFVRNAEETLNHNKHNNSKSVKILNSQDFDTQQSSLNKAWIDLQQILNNLKISGIGLSNKERDELSKIYYKTDKKHKKDGLLTDSEIDEFTQKLKKSKIKRTNQNAVNNIMAFFDSKNNMTDAEIYASNITTASNKLFNEDIVYEAFSKVTQDNITDVMQQYYNMNKRFNFFQQIAKSCNSYSNISSNIQKKLLNTAVWLLSYAKQNKLYIADYEKQIAFYIDHNQIALLAHELDNLYMRIYVSETDTATVNKAPIYSLNGIIDKPFAQGKTNDCWLLSAIIASQNNLEAKEKINNMLRYDTEKDNISVNIQGKEYSIDIDEVYGNIECSVGDFDARVLEIAVNKLLHSKKDWSINKISPLANGFINLYGKNNVEIKEHKINQEYFAALEKDGVISTIGTDKNAGEYNLYDEQDNIVHIIGGHACAVVGKDDKYLYLIDPRKPEGRIKCPLEYASKVFLTAVTVNLK